MADENEQENDYRELSPERLHKLLGCFVNILLVEGDEIKGWVYTIDPVSHTIVIARERDAEQNETDQSDPRPIVFVLSKAIRELQVVKTTRKEPQWLKNFALKEQHKYSNEELEKRKANLVDWLNKNRVPILDINSSDGAVKVAGGLEIEPPYDMDSCRGTNEIVLDRIRKLISSMPNG